jgi:hypothetical protein
LTLLLFCPVHQCPLIIDDGKAAFNRIGALPGVRGRDMIAPQQLICVTSALDYR